MKYPNFNIYLKVKEMAKVKISIPTHVQAIQKAFKKEGKQLYLVGGAVRDAILGKKPKDFDLATNAKPDEVKAIAEKHGLKTTDTVGNRFAVVIVNGEEIATFRKDVGKGRQPDAIDIDNVDIEGDVRRRDLTVNALFYDLDKKKIVDLVGGIADLHKKKIKMVGDAQERIDDDPLRKLRAVRFYGSLGGKIDKPTYDAIKKSNALPAVSAEAIHDEFKKGIEKAKSTKKYFEMMDELNLLVKVFPGIKVKKPFIDNNNMSIQLAWMIPDNKLEKLKSLKYSNEEVDDAKFLNSLRDFKAENAPKLKKNFKNTKLKPVELKTWAKLINFKDVNKFLKYEPGSVKFEDAPDDIKNAKDKSLRGKWVMDQEIKKFRMSEILLNQLEMEFLAEAVIGKWRKPDAGMIERAISNRNYVGVYYEEDENSDTVSGFRLIEPYAFGSGYKHSQTNEVTHENDDYLRAFVVMNSKKDPKIQKAVNSRKSISKSKATPHWRMLKVERIKKWVNLERKFKGNRPLYNSQDKNINNIKASV